MRRKLYRAISIIIVLSLFVISIPADAFASDLPSEIFEDLPLDAETEEVHFTFAHWNAYQFQVRL